ncbi:MAG: tetratricopeptide repeat protein [Candidatus Gastranaerophilaceae bacterium]
MIIYDDWNNAIYNYYFKDKNLPPDFLFFVDENIISEIGKGFDTENPIKDFCKCIRNRITYNDKIDLDKSNWVSRKPERNTAIIAFFIYIASCLGEKNSDNFIDSYWEICANKLNIPLKKNQSVFEYNPQNKKKYFDMFNQFATFISNQNHLNFRFESLYNRTEGQSDYIGLPISQSMISTKDRYLLSQVFDKYNDRKFDSLYSYVVNNPEGYSKIFKKLCRDSKYSYKIKETVRYLRENWDNVVVDIDEKSKTGSRILAAPFLIGFYKTQYGDFKIGVTTYNKNNEKLSFKYKNIDYELLQRGNGKFYQLNTKFFDNTNNNVFENYSIISNLKIKLKNKLTEKNFILLTQADDGSYVQVPNNFVMQNTTFSILGTRDFFENEYTSYFEDYVEELKQPLNTNIEDIYIVTDLFAESYDNEYIKLATKDKVTPEKGLKIDRNTYVEGAGPVISVKGLSHIEITDDLYKTKYESSNAHLLTIKESKNYEIGSYKIWCNHAENKEGFSIDDISTIEPKKSNSRIYQIVSPTDIVKKYSAEKPEQYISGAFICGLDIVEEDISDNLDEIENYNKIAEEFYKNEQYELAVENWNEVLKLNPEYEIDYFKLAYAQDEIGKDKEALKNYRKYLKTNPNNAATYNNIGVIYKNREDYKKAIQYYKKAHKADTEEILYINNLADAYYKNEQYELAVENWNEVLKLNPEYEINYLNLAYAQDEIGDLNSALVNCCKFIENNPNDSNIYIAYNNRGYALEQLNHYEQAFQDYKKSLELNPDFEMAQKNLKRIEQPLAQDIYKNALELKEDENYNKIYQLAENAINMGLEIADMYHIAGVALYFEKRFKEASKYYQKAYDLVQTEKFYDSDIKAKILEYYDEITKIK